MSDKFKDRLRAARVSRNMTQVDLARKMSCTSMVVSHYETGLHEPGASNLKRLAKILNVSADFLIGLTR